MTSFEKDYQDAKEGNGIEVLKKRKKQLQELDKKLRYCNNSFRSECIMQEIERKQKEYQKIDDLF